MEIKFSSKKKEAIFKNLNSQTYKELFGYVEKKVKAYRESLKKK